MLTRTILLGLSTLLLFSACTKDDSGNDSNVISTSLTGTWEMRQVFGMAGIKNYAAGNGNVLRFTDTSYELYTDNKFTRKGRYTTTPDTTVTANVCLNLLSGQFAKRIMYDGNTMADKIFFQIDNNQLSFVSGCFAIDAGSKQVYQRQKDGTGPHE